MKKLQIKDKKKRLFLNAETKMATVLRKESIEQQLKNEDSQNIPSQYIDLHLRQNRMRETKILQKRQTKTVAIFNKFSVDAKEEEAMFSTKQTKEQTPLKVQSPKKKKKFKVGIMDDNFIDLCNFETINTDAVRQQIQLRKSRKLIKYQPAFRSRKSISLPKIQQAKSKINTSRNIPFVTICQYIPELLDILKDSQFLQIEDEKVIVQKNNFQDLLNYMMHLTRAQSKNHVKQLLQFYQQFEPLQQVSDKIFFKLREKKYVKARSKLSLCSKTLNFKVVGGEKEKKSKACKTPTQEPEKINEERQLSLPLEDFDFDMTRVRQALQRVRKNLNEYKSFIMEGDWRQKLLQIPPSPQTQLKISKEIKKLYHTILEDPLLVPDLKEKLMNNLIKKIMKCCTFNAAEIQTMAKNKSASVNDFIQEMIEWQATQNSKEQLILKVTNKLKSDLQGTSYILKKVLKQQIDVSQVLQKYLGNEKEFMKKHLRQCSSFCEKSILRYMSVPQR